jgi:hypothetical protein
MCYLLACVICNSCSRSLLQQFVVFGEAIRANAIVDVTLMNEIKNAIFQRRKRLANPVRLERTAVPACVAFSTIRPVITEKDKTSQPAATTMTSLPIFPALLFCISRMLNSSTLFSSFLPIKSLKEKRNLA